MATNNEQRDLPSAEELRTLQEALTKSIQEGNSEQAAVLAGQLASLTKTRQDVREGSQEIMSAAQIINSTHTSVANFLQQVNSTMFSFGGNPPSPDNTLAVFGEWDKVLRGFEHDLERAVGMLDNVSNKNIPTAVRADKKSTINVALAFQDRLGKLKKALDGLRELNRECEDMWADCVVSLASETVEFASEMTD